MRQLINDFVAVAANSLPRVEPIYEFGSIQVEGQEDMSDLRPLYAGLEYVGCDMREGPGVDKVLNLHDIDLPSESVGTLICMDTLEHVEYPRKALDEIHRVLRSDGIAIISSVMNFHIHDFPHDYWRFTPEAFRSLLKPFESSFVGAAGRADFPHTVVGVGFKGAQPDMKTFNALFSDWEKEQNRLKITFKLIRRMLFPPILSRKGRRVMIE